MTLYSEDMAGVCVDSGHRLLISDCEIGVKSSTNTMVMLENDLRYSKHHEYQITCCLSITLTNIFTAE